MAKDTPKMQSWQVFHYARKYLGRSALYTIFGKKNARSVDYWCENPVYTSKQESAYDPINGVKTLLTALDDQGHTSVVRSAIKFLTSETSLDNGTDCGVAELLPTMAEEILADFISVSRLQQAIDNKMDVAEVMAAKDLAVAEIERTVAKYIKETE